MACPARQPAERPFYPQLLSFQRCSEVHGGAPHGRLATAPRVPPAARLQKTDSHLLFPETHSEGLRVEGLLLTTSGKRSYFSSAGANYSGLTSVASGLGHPPQQMVVKWAPAVSSAAGTLPARSFAPAPFWPLGLR